MSESTQLIAPPDVVHIERFSAQAQSLGALQPIETEQAWLEDAGLPFLVKWLSTLAAKPRPTKPGRQGMHNPFAEPEPALTLGELAPHHRLILNKYPVMTGHLLIVTRDFKSQDCPLEAGDFQALAPLIAANGGLGFYNGGTIAGASQRHKHLQWIPQLPPIATRRATLPPELASQLDFRQAWTPLPAGWTHTAEAGEVLAQCYRRLMAEADAWVDDGAPAPYNLLLTREWMWVVPRRAECWRQMSINALGFAGSLFVKTPTGFAELAEAGALNALRAVTWPA